MKSVIKFIALVFFNMWKTSSAYPVNGFYMIWKIGAKNFETMIHTSYTGSLNSGWGMGIIRLHLAEALKDQTTDVSNSFLSLFKLIYISVKDLRMLVQIYVML